MSESTHEEAHTGPIKTPKQLLVAVFLSFVVPVFIIIGLVHYVTSEENAREEQEIDTVTCAEELPEEPNVSSAASVATRAVVRAIMSSLALRRSFLRNVYAGKMFRQEI